MDKSSRRNVMIVASGLAFVGAIILFVALIVFWPRETHETTSKGGENSSIASLVCQTSAPTAAFFKDDRAANPLYVMKASYEDDELTSVSFNYSAKFASKDTAYSVSSAMVADYNIYMGKQSVEPSTYYPNIRNLDEEVRIDLFSKAKDLTLAFSKVVLSESSTNGSFAKKSHKEMKKLFESYGYRCEYAE